MRTLEEIFKQNKGRRIHRYVHVLEVYADHFARFRGTDVRVLEIGTTGGGSLLMWKEYFGENAKIFGIDVSNPGINDPQVETHIINQGDRAALKEFVKNVGTLDIIIDDASHESPLQIISFEELFPALTLGGLYAVEDLHCSYRECYGGGYKYAGSFVEYTKHMIDFFHHSEWGKIYPGVAPQEHFRRIFGVFYYPTVVIIEKNNASILVNSALLTGEGTIVDSYHDIFGHRFNRFK